MEIDRSGPEGSLGDPRLESLAIKRLAEEFRSNYKIFKETEGFESVFPLLLLDYVDSENGALIPYSDYSIRANIKPTDFKRIIMPAFAGDMSTFPKPCTIQRTETLKDFPFELPPSLKSFKEMGVRKTSTIFPLKAKSPFVADIRRIVVTRMFGKSGLFKDDIGELWIGRRWIDAGMHHRLSELTSS